MGIVISDQPREILEVNVKVAMGGVDGDDVKDMPLEEFMKLMPEGYVADMWVRGSDNRNLEWYVVARGKHSRAFPVAHRDKADFNEEAAKLLALSEWPA